VGACRRGAHARVFPFRGPKRPGKHSPGFTLVPPPELALKGRPGARYPSTILSRNAAVFSGFLTATLHLFPLKKRVEGRPAHSCRFAFPAMLVVFRQRTCRNLHSFTVLRKIASSAGSRLAWAFPRFEEANASRIRLDRASDPTTCYGTTSHCCM
jgi:hypothetical protein